MADFYGVYNELIICKSGEVIGNYIDNSRIFTQEPIPFKDTEDGGNVNIVGVVTVDNVPAKRKVRLFCLQSGRLIRETWSDPITGAYAFNNVKNQLYFIWGEDYTKVYDPISHYPLLA